MSRLRASLCILSIRVKLSILHVVDPCKREELGLVGTHNDTSPLIAHILHNRGKTLWTDCLCHLVTIVDL